MKSRRSVTPVQSVRTLDEYEDCEFRDTTTNAARRARKLPTLEDYDRSETPDGDE